MTPGPWLVGGVGLLGAVAATRHRPRLPDRLLPGKNGEFYISNCGCHCDDLSNFPPRRASLEAGQVVKVVIPGSEADPD
jgi:hypothetical protein